MSTTGWLWTLVIIIILLLVGVAWYTARPAAPVVDVPANYTPSTMIDEATSTIEGATSTAPDLKG